MRKVVLLAVIVPCLLACALSAGAVLNVPLYGQCDEPWGDVDYLDHSTTKTLCDAGCALTCCVMVVRYYGVTNGPNGEDVTPRTLNNWLKKNHGFVGRDIVWAAVARFTQLAKSRNNNNSVKYVGPIQRVKQYTQSIVDTDLSNGKPVILNVKNSKHFVVCTGKSGTIYSMNDPMRYSNSLLYYSNTWQGIRRYERASGPGQSPDEDCSALSVWGDDWLDLCLVDAQGQRTGVDPSTGQEVNEIPNANYGLEPAVTDELWGDPVGPDFKCVDVSTPASNSYTLKVFSVSGYSGSYTIRIYGLDSTANYFYQEISGYLNTGQTNEHTIQQPAAHTIPVAKTYLGSGFEVRGKIASSASDSAAGMYIQEPGRSAGIKVVPDPSDPNLPYSVGDVVDVAGLIELVNGELQFSDAQISRTSSGSTVNPVGMPNKSLGGATFGEQPEITGASGLNNVGLLVTTWGQVTAVGADYFYINDGSQLLDGSGNTGVKISAAGLSLPNVEDYVVVTGISGASVLDSNTIRLLRVRAQSDINVVQAGQQGMMPGGPEFGGVDSWESQTNWLIRMTPSAEGCGSMGEFLLGAFTDYTDGQDTDPSLIAGTEGDASPTPPMPYVGLESTVFIGSLDLKSPITGTETKVWTLRAYTGGGASGPVVINISPGYYETTDYDPAYSFGGVDYQYRFEGPMVPGGSEVFTFANPMPTAWSYSAAPGDILTVTVEPVDQ